MHRKLGWVEYRDPIKLIDHPSNMEIGLCFYKKGANNKWVSDLMDHSMVDSYTIITLASMTYIVDLDTYVLHMGDEKVFNNPY